MKNFTLTICLLVTALCAAQQDAWVYFNAKPDAEFYLANPLEMLSQRALDRRSAQNIALDFADVPLHEPYRIAVDNASGIEVMAASKWLNALHVRGSQENIMALDALDFVSSIDFANDALDVGRGNAVNKKMETQVDFAYGNSANQIQMLNGHLLHQQDFTGSGKIIAVLDAGFPGVDVAGPFARLRDSNLILGGYNFVDRSDDFYTRSSHGTMVLSTMGGYVEGQLVGTAPDAGYYLFITEDTGSENPVEESLWVEAAEYADSLGVDIINSSLGYFKYDDPGYSYDFEDLDGQTAFASRGANMAFSRGILVVTSAGNSGNSANPNISVPADAPGALTVGAVNAAGNHASFSSVGPTADGRIKPDVVTQGQGAVIASAAGTVTTGNGTSFSGPILAGMAASLWQAVPSLTSQQLSDVIRQSAHLFATPNFQMGYGIPNFQQALEEALLTVTGHNIVQPVIYPNPFSDNLMLVNISPGAVFSLYDAAGRRLVKTLPGQTEVATAGLSSGIFYYTLQSGQNTASGKLVRR